MWITPDALMRHLPSVACFSGHRRCFTLLLHCLLPRLWGCWVPCLALRIILSGSGSAGSNKRGTAS